MTSKLIQIQVTIRKNISFYMLNFLPNKRNSENENAIITPKYFTFNCKNKFNFYHQDNGQDHDLLAQANPFAFQMI